jgi:energy-coupling factor transport system permease protein
VCLFSVSRLEQVLLFIPVFPLLLLYLRFPLSLFFRGLWPLLFLLLFTFCIHLFQTEGELLFRFYSLTATWEGLNKGLFYTLRILLVVCGSSILTITTSSQEITYALERVLFPLSYVKFPVQEFALMMAISLRFIPVLLEELQLLIEVQGARGASFKKGPLKRRMHCIVSLFVPLFQSAMDRADNLAIAMEIRGYRPGGARTHYRSYRAGWVDSLAAGLFVGLSVISIYWL